MPGTHDPAETPAEVIRRLNQAAGDAATSFHAMEEATEEFYAAMHNADWTDDNPGWRLEGFRWRPDASEEEWIP